MSYSDEIKRSSIAENWLFILNNDNSGALRFAFSDTLSFASNNWEDYNAQWDSETDTWDTAEDEQFFYGVILNKPTIRESINLSNSTSKSSNISITIPDFNYQGSPISEELFGGTNHYINQSVTVYSLINSQTNQIGSFRLTDISSNGDKISLSMTSHRPWDFIDFPQSTSDTKIYVPVSYGVFTPNSNSYYDTTVATHDLANSIFDVDSVKTLRPSLFNNSADKNGFFLCDESAKADSRAEFWDKSANAFIPINDENNTAITTSILNAGQYCTKSENEYKRALKIRPTSNSISYDPDSIPTSNLSNIYDTGASWLTNKATIGSHTATDGSQEWIEITLNGIPDLDGDFVRGKLFLTTEWNLTSFTGALSTFAFSYTVDGTSFTQVSEQLGDRPKTTDSYTITELPDSLELQMKWGAESGASNFITGEFYIYNVFMLVEYKTRDDQLKMVYIGADGLTHGITGLSGAITEVHEAHLDLLNRFTGLDVATNPATDIDGWSDLDTSKDWAIRWWQLEPTELKKSLEKLQYEGGFIFRYKADGSPQYIHIKDSHTTDETLTKLDMKDITVKPSSLSSLLTKMDVSYEKHPAESRYLTTQTCTNALSRTNYNIQSKENIKQVKLDAYVSPAIPIIAIGNPNDDFYNYYDNIFGDIKMIISATIVNPVYYTLEVGKILAFSDMHPIKAFNTSWSGLQFMITSLSRTPGTMKFTARQI